MIIGTYKGYEMTCEGISYCCTTLRLRGYRDDLQLRRAIDRELRKVRTDCAICHKPHTYKDTSCTVWL